MLKVWIARDKAHNKLKIFTKRPERGAWHLPESQRQFWYLLITNEDRCDYGKLLLPSDHPWGNGLTWESDPKELNLVEVEQVEALKKTMRKQDEVIGYFVHAELTTLQIRWKDLNNHENDEDIIEQFGQILHKRMQELKTNQS